MCCYEGGRAKMIISRDVVFVENVMYIDDKTRENAKQTAEREKSGQEDNHGQKEPLAFEHDNTKKRGQLSYDILVGKDKTDDCDKTKQGRDNQSKVALHGLQKAIKSREKGMRAKEEKKRKRTCMTPCTINMQ